MTQMVPLGNALAGWRHSPGRVCHSPSRCRRCTRSIRTAASAARGYV